MTRGIRSNIINSCYYHSRKVLFLKKISKKTFFFGCWGGQRCEMVFSAFLSFSKREARIGDFFFLPESRSRRKNLSTTTTEMRKKSPHEKVPKCDLERIFFVFFFCAIPLPLTHTPRAAKILAELCNQTFRTSRSSCWCLFIYICAPHVIAGASNVKLFARCEPRGDRQTPSASRIAFICPSSPFFLPSPPTTSSPIKPEIMFTKIYFLLLFSVFFFFAQFFSFFFRYESENLV